MGYSTIPMMYTSTMIESKQADKMVGAEMALSSSSAASLSILFTYQTRHLRILCRWKEKKMILTFRTAFKDFIHCQYYSPTRPDTCVFHRPQCHGGATIRTFEHLVLGLHNILYIVNIIHQTSAYSVHHQKKDGERTFGFKTAYKLRNSAVHRSKAE